MAMVVMSHAMSAEKVLINPQTLRRHQDLAALAWKRGLLCGALKILIRKKKCHNVNQFLCNTGHKITRQLPDTISNSSLLWLRRHHYHVTEPAWLHSLA